MIYELIDKFEIAATPQEVWDTICVPENLKKVTPKWMGMTVKSPQPVEVALGKRIDYTMAWQGLPLRWSSLITEHDPPYRIAYIQLKGPYQFWLHQHQFIETDNGTLVQDRCLYSLPFGPVGRIVHFLAVRHNVMDIFKTRRRRLRERLGKLRSVDGPRIRPVAGS